MPLKLPNVETVPYPIRYFVKGAMLLLATAVVAGIISYILKTYSEILKDLFVVGVVVLATMLVGWLVDTA